MTFSLQDKEKVYAGLPHGTEPPVLQESCNSFQKESQVLPKEAATGGPLMNSRHGLYIQSPGTFFQRASNLWHIFLNLLTGLFGISEIVQNLSHALIHFLSGALKLCVWPAQIAAHWAKKLFFEKIPLPSGTVASYVFSSVSTVALFVFWSVLLCLYCSLGFYQSGFRILSFFGFGVGTWLGAWLGTPAFLAKKYLPKVIITLYLIVTSTPVFISIILGLALYPPTQAFLLDYFNFLKSEPWWGAFLWLFWWKASKIIIHTYSYVFLTEANLYRPAAKPKFTPTDVTVIVPSINEFGEEFNRTLKSIIANFPAEIIVSTAKQTNLDKAKASCKDLEEQMGLRSGTIVVTAVNVANKRAQFVHALKKVETPITCYADDHVFWPITFLKHALAPFEDPLVGLVGTVKRVERVKTGSFMERFLNYIAVIYLERHNFECTASYNLDGGVFVISGRTALTRTEIMHSVEFRQGFLNEKWWWGTVGPMKVDDDNFITRFMVNHGYKTVFHNEPAALMQTSLGVEGGFEKFRGQLIRWVRTTWRSNSTSLFAERKVWHAHSWTTYAMMISLFFNISLIYDPLLFYTLSRSGFLKEYGYALLAFLVVSKTIKQVPHLIRNPDDWPFWLANFLFVYFHSMLKIYAFFTAKNTAWTGRKDVDAKGDPEHEQGISCGGKGELRPKRPNRHNSTERVYDNGPWNNWNFVGIALKRTGSSLRDVGQSLKRTASGLWGANEKDSPSV